MTERFEYIASIISSLSILLIFIGISLFFYGAIKKIKWLNGYGIGKNFLFLKLPRGAIKIVYSAIMSGREIANIQKGSFQQMK